MYWSRGAVHLNARVLFIS
jgi:hypothetical protein